MDQFTVRRAVLDDEPAIEDLTSTVERLVLQVPWGDVERALAAQTRGQNMDGATVDLLLGEQDSRMGCLWGSFVGPETVAQIRILGLHDDWPVDETLAALLPPVSQVLRKKKIETVSFVGVEQWLLDGLLANGFRHINTIVTMQKIDLAIPDTGNTQVVVRPATTDDIPSILAIDQVAFEPLWRNTPYTLEEQLEYSPFFVVAQWDGALAGYEYASMTGRHAHLTRIAVSPDYQGLGIGVRLMAEAIAFFRRRAAFGVTLNTQQDNRRARRLYEWFGFRPLGKEAEVVVYDL